MIMIVAISNTGVVVAIISVLLAVAVVYIVGLIVRNIQLNKKLVQAKSKFLKQSISTIMCSNAITVIIRVQSQHMN